MFNVKVLVITLISFFSILTTVKGQTNDKIINSYDEFEGLRIVKSEPLPIESKGYDGSSYVIFETRMSEVSNTTQFELTIRAKSKLTKEVKIDSPLGDTSKEILPYHFKNVDKVYLLIEESRYIISKDYFTVSADADVYDTNIDIISRSQMREETEFKNEELVLNLTNDFFQELVNSDLVRLRISDIEFTIYKNKLEVGIEILDKFLGYE